MDHDRLIDLLLNSHNLELVNIRVKIGDIVSKAYHLNIGELFGRPVDKDALEEAKKGTEEIKSLIEGAIGEDIEISNDTLYNDILHPVYFKLIERKL